MLKNAEMINKMSKMTGMMLGRSGWVLRGCHVQGQWYSVLARQLVQSPRLSRASSSLIIEGIQGGEAFSPSAAKTLVGQLLDRTKPPRLDESIQGVQDGPGITQIETDHLKNVTPGYSIESTFHSYIQKFQTDGQSYSSVPYSAMETYWRSPQGVQGDHCPNFSVWEENSPRFKLNYKSDHQLQEIQNQRTSLSEVFAEQETLLQKVAQDLRENVASKQITSMVTTYLMGSSLVCPQPQGIQGDSCDTFKLWLENCSKYHFNGCNIDLVNDETGHNSMAKISRDHTVFVAAEGSKPAGGAEGVGDQGDHNSPPSHSNPQGDGEPKLNQRQKLKRAVKEYGATVVVFHVGISLLSLGGFYLAVSSGLDVVGMLQKIGVGQSILESRLATGASTFVIAYAVHKVFAPVRIATTLTATPFIVRYLRSKGVLKPPKPKTA